MQRQPARPLSSYAIFTTFLSLAAIACGSGEDGNSSGGWKPLGEQYFTGVVQNNFSISAQGETVSVGYWDIDLDKPCVKKTATTGGDWEYLGGGPIPVEQLDVDPLSDTTFKFRQDNGLSVVAFNRSFPLAEYVFFTQEGEGDWNLLPQMPLEQLPGYADGLTEIDQDFDFTVKDGVIYVVVKDGEHTYPTENMCMTVFTNTNGTWSMLPERICQDMDNFANSVGYDEITIQASDNGRVYLGYFRHEHQDSLTSIGVSMYDGAGWTTLADSSLYPIGTDSYAETKFGMEVFSSGAEDSLAIAIGGPTNESHVFSYTQGSWSELPASGIKAGLGTRLGISLRGCADCIYLAYTDSMTVMDGLTVKKFKDGAWETVGKRSFTEDVYEYYDNIIATDGSNAYVCFQESVDFPDKNSRGKLSVFWYEDSK